jgi:2-oxoglutarate dehydrogenase E2 component (dihydrolipoamide succinyltransferase)
MAADKIDIKVPVLPESVSDATIATWHKKPGELVKRDENLVDIETDKVVLEVVAPADGTLESILHATGDTVKGEQVIAVFKSGAVSAAPVAEAKSEAQPAAAASAASQAPAGPAVRRMMGEKDIAAENISGTGKSGRITKEDVMKATQASSVSVSADMAVMGARAEKRVPMTRLRSRIAERLVQSQQTAAILTTFNEVNMKPVMDLRAKYKDAFEKRHGVKLGFMSFFTRAVVEALKRFPIVNSSIDGNDIVYHGYMDIGIAVSSPRGLVVPVIRNTETLSMAEIEQKIAEYGKKAQTGQLGIEDMTGGTFTISNGGTFGSLMSTPIINPPQTGILGMHKIEERAVVENGQIVIRPMMYVAMSYDHRLIDGSESVRFLVTIKEMLEDPARLVLEV